MYGVGNRKRRIQPGNAINYIAMLIIIITKVMRGKTMHNPYIVCTPALSHSHLLCRCSYAGLRDFAYITFSAYTRELRVKIL